jgi:anti-anti-sigma regulatory factor
MGQVRSGARESSTAAPAIHTLHGGYYDVSRRAELQAELDAIEPHSDVVIDLASTEHLDCSSLGIMIGRLREWRVAKPATQLRLRNVTPQLTRVLGILKLDELFILEAPVATAG